MYLYDGTLYERVSVNIGIKSESEWDERVVAVNAHIHTFIVNDFPSLCMCCCADVCDARVCGFHIYFTRLLATSFACTGPAHPRNKLTLFPLLFKLLFFVFVFKKQTSHFRYIYPIWAALFENNRHSSMWINWNVWRDFVRVLQQWNGWLINWHQTLMYQFSPQFMPNIERAPTTKLTKLLVGQWYMWYVLWGLAPKNTLWECAYKFI